MFTMWRQTVRKRLQAKLNAVKTELRRRLHHSTPDVGQWLRSVVSGHFRYYGVPMNAPALHIFRFQVGCSGIARFLGAVRTAASPGTACGG
jgi:hypothetical protein